MKSRRLIEYARKLRKSSTEAENVLWRRLRHRKLARFKFRRQHVLGQYILDFYCLSARLAIEVDGGGHGARRQALYDVYRTADLQEQGIRVLRFWNHEVLQQTDDVMAEIFRALEKGAGRTCVDR